MWWATWFAAGRLRRTYPGGDPPPGSVDSGSACKEAFPSLLVDRCGELERDRRGPGLLGERALVCGDRARGEGHLRRQIGEPARRDRGVERQQLERGARHRGGVVVEREERDSLVVEPRGRADDAERDGA